MDVGSVSGGVAGVVVVGLAATTAVAAAVWRLAGVGEGLREVRDAWLTGTRAGEAASLPQRLVAAAAGSSLVVQESMAAARASLDEHKDPRCYNHIGWLGEDGNAMVRDLVDLLLFHSKDWLNQAGLLDEVFASNKDAYETLHQVAAMSGRIMPRDGKEDLVLAKEAPPTPPLQKPPKTATERGLPSDEDIPDLDVGPPSVPSQPTQPSSPVHGKSTVRSRTKSSGGRDKNSGGKSKLTSVKKIKSPKTKSTAHSRRGPIGKESTKGAAAAEPRGGGDEPKAPDEPRSSSARQPPSAARAVSTAREDDGLSHDLSSAKSLPSNQSQQKPQP